MLWPYLVTFQIFELFITFRRCIRRRQMQSDISLSHNLFEKIKRTMLVVLHIVQNVVDVTTTVLNARSRTHVRTDGATKKIQATTKALSMCLR